MSVARKQIRVFRYVRAVRDVCRDAPKRPTVQFRFRTRQRASVTNRIAFVFRHAPTKQRPVTDRRTEYGKQYAVAPRKRLSVTIYRARRTARNDTRTTAVFRAVPKTANEMPNRYFVVSAESDTGYPYGSGDTRTAFGNNDNNYRRYEKIVFPFGRLRGTSNDS